MSILVCDDHALVRSALAMVAEEVSPGQPVFTARDYPEAWSLAEAAGELSLCLVDLHMPGAEPLEGVKGLQCRAPGAKLVVFTGSDRDEDLVGALDLGVDAFVSKSAEAEVLAAALRHVLAGGRFLPARLAERVAALPRPGEAPFGRLSERQADVLRRMAEGMANKEIARDLGLSPATVKSHVAQVIGLMGAANRTEASAKARALGLV